MYSFGKRLENLRESYGYTKKDVSLKLGFTANVYGSYERGERRPSLETLIKLADMFDTSLDYLIQGKTNTSDINSQFEVNIIHILDKYNISNLALLDLEKWKSLSKKGIEEIIHHFEWTVEKTNTKTTDY
ncbi:helix-turn-helix domain-containing protein [Pseudogracilibacillus auburnensis]|uniref:Transcriptional regulator with XRE-family HTH domain n=1 Tax=Pseudogracilibacillus auburnensis TaxID=1494959 RepID=A0A2V3VNF8_9BACI|nr:helix-turn-helix transcriptional regulator [Pseudogracilibacillus auburnensis]PXW83326.1 transcriptional regulator with XRE-family HTH domain [Pseudogracilibacillus auburnensis]